MADERLRWTDERLDDFARDTRDEFDAHEQAIKYFQSQELAELRGRAADLEAKIQQARTRRVGYAIAIGIPLLAATIGALLGAILGHAL